jgi:predicted DNA repair protein MutK
MQQVIVLSGIALLMTVGVYGLVAGIVKLDDAGLYLSQRGSAAMQAFGRGILWLAPWLMKLLSVVGTAAMFMVGGGILTHGIPGAHGLIHHWVEAVGGVPGVGGVLAVLAPTLVDALFGVLVGALVLALVSVAGKAWGALRA